MIAALEGSALVVQIPVAWGDMDAFRHVNGVMYFRYFEDVRVAYFRKIGFLDELDRTGIGPVVATAQCKYRRPIHYPDTLQIGVWVEGVEETRFTLRYAIYSEKLGDVAATGETGMSSFDFKKGAKAPIPPVIRQALETVSGITAD